MDGELTSNDSSMGGSGMYSVEHSQAIPFYGGPLLSGSKKSEISVRSRDRMSEDRTTSLKTPPGEHPAVVPTSVGDTADPRALPPVLVTVSGLTLSCGASSTSGSASRSPMPEFSELVGGLL